MSDSSSFSKLRDDEDFFDTVMPLSESLIQRGHNRVGEKYKHLLKRRTLRQRSSSSLLKKRISNEGDSTDVVEDDFSENMPLSQSLIQRAHQYAGEKYKNIVSKPWKRRGGQSSSSSSKRIASNVSEFDSCDDLHDEFSENMPLSQSLIQRGHNRVGQKYQNLIKQPRQPRDTPPAVEGEQRQQRSLYNDDAISVVGASPESGQSSPVTQLESHKELSDKENADVPAVKQKVGSIVNERESSDNEHQSILQSTPQRPGSHLTRNEIMGITPIVKELPFSKIHKTIVERHQHDDNQELLVAALARSETINALDPVHTDILCNTECPMSGARRQLKTCRLYPILCLRRVSLPKTKRQEKSSSVPLIPSKTSASQEAVSPRRMKKQSSLPRNNSTVTPARIYGSVLNYLSRTSSTQASLPSSQKSTSSQIVNEDIVNSNSEDRDSHQLTEQNSEEPAIPPVSIPNVEKQTFSSMVVTSAKKRRVSSDKSDMEIDNNVMNESPPERLKTLASITMQSPKNSVNTLIVNFTKSARKKVKKSKASNRDTASQMSSLSLSNSHKTPSQRVDITTSSTTREECKRSDASNSSDSEPAIENDNKMINTSRKRQPKKKKSQPVLQIASHRAQHSKGSSSSYKTNTTSRKRKMKTLAELQDNFNMVQKDYLTQALRETRLNFSKSDLASFHDFLNELLETLCNSLCEQAARPYGMFTYRQLENALKTKNLIDPSLGKNSLLIMIASIVPYSIYREAKGILIPRDNEFDTFGI